MTRFVQLVVPAAVALTLLLAADWLLQPVPVPAATAVLGGFLGLGWGRRARWARLGIGVAAGLLAGVGVHLWVHRTGQSPAPAEGLLAHLAKDGAIGLGVALLVLAAVVLVRNALNRTSPSRPGGGPGDSGPPRPG